MVTILFMSPAIDPHLTLRRVERQHHLVSTLAGARTRRTVQQLADDLGVSQRTIARDIQRLRHSGVPLDVTPGPGGGVSLRASSAPQPIAFDTAELAALVASLAALGPSATEPAQSAMNKLVRALR